MGPPEDMVFGDIQFREPTRLQRPDRDPRRAWLAFGTPDDDDLPIFLDHRPADQIERHAQSDHSVELGGILLGKECVDPATGQPFVWITQALEARHYENTSASFTYTHDSWEEISRERERRFPDLDIVGWYHTHPNFGIFLSGHDEFIHRHFFSQPLQIAYVVDPVRNTRGFFRWSDGGRLNPVGGFFLIGDRSDRATLARLANHLENLAGGDGPSGFSPRLEAELIHMLKRSQAPAVTERSSTGGSLLALLGVLLGGLLAVILFWLNAVGHDLRIQSESLAALSSGGPGGTLPPSGQVEVDAKVHVLDALLAEVRVGDPPQALSDRLTRVFDTIDAEQRRAARLSVENEALAALADQRKKDSDLLRSSFLQTQIRARKDAEGLRRATAELAELRGDTGAADSKNGLSATGLASRYTWALWAAVLGWLGFLAVGLALLGRWVSDRRAAAEAEALGRSNRTVVNINPGAPTHVIE